MPSLSLKDLAIRGTAWTVLGYVGSQGLRLGGNLILTRLLVPEMFGLMALVYVFITGLDLFSDIGVGPNIIQSKQGDDPDFLNTAWTVQIFRGFGVWVCCFIIAWPVANFYENESLIWLIPTVGLASVIAGFNSTSLFTLNRKLSLGKLTRYEFGVQTIGLVIMVVWAWVSPTIWALVIGNLVSKLIGMIWSHRLDSGGNRFALDRGALQALFQFGRWVFVSTTMVFLAGQVDRLILGKLFSLELLGIYTVAFTFSELPRQIIVNVSRKVIFPVVSRQSDLPRQSLRTKILQKRKLLLIGLALFIAVFACFGDFLVIGLYDQRYSQAGWMLQILAVGVWPTILADVMARCLYAIGKPQYLAIGHLARFSFTVIMLPLGYYQLGVLGALIAITLNDLPMYGVIAYGLWREKLTSFRQDLQATALLIGIISLLLTVRVMLGLGLSVTEISYL